jgi:Type II secretion system protein C
MNAIIQKNLHTAQIMVLIVVVLFQISLNIRDFRTTELPIAPPVTQQPMPNLSTLNNTHQWGTFGQSPNSATVTQLFRLMGVFQAKPVELSSAVISPAKDGEQQLYRVGDKLPDGSQVNRIEDHRVIIRRQDGQLVSILLDETAPLPEGKANASPAPLAPTGYPTTVPPYMQSIPIQQNGAMPMGMPNIEEMKMRMMKHR